jgi:DnaJ-domain-containing protein 1
VELVAVILMIGAGIGVAAFVVLAVTIARHEGSHANGGAQASVRPDLERLAASILRQLLVLGGTRPDDAMREIRRRAGLMAQVTNGIDVANWGERFAQVAGPQQRAWLLDMAVQCIAIRTTPVPLRQYSALLDLSFALGFQTDALARLREQYGFEYVDHAKNGRPREADRAGGAATLYTRDARPPEELLRVLEIEEHGASRQAIIAAYRRLAAQHHPDRVHLQPADVQSAAAARFIEITRAYETLLALYRE